MGQNGASGMPPGPSPLGTLQVVPGANETPLGNRPFPLVAVATIGAVSPQTGKTLAEVGFLLILFAGVWLVAAQIPAFKMATARTIVAGIALALAGLLLIIATHWGHFG